jgi:serine/threonine protein phosphatase 1
VEPELKNRLFPFHQVKGEESLAKNGRLLVIGDVHGCIQELEKLIKVLKPEKNDRMIFLGDLINKGPDTKSVLNLARSLKGYSILGNHEYRLLKFYHSIDSLQLRSYEKSTIESMDEEDWDYLKSMVLWLEQPKEGRVFVHGGFLPGSPWFTQPAKVVTQIQMIDKKGVPRKRGETQDGQFWANLWDQKPFVVYGHTPRKKIHRTTNSLGIDTGCVWGGHLTALILPENEIVQIKAKKNYTK